MRVEGWCGGWAHEHTPVGQPVDQHLIQEVAHHALKERHGCIKARQGERVNLPSNKQNCSSGGRGGGGKRWR